MRAVLCAVVPCRFLPAVGVVLCRVLVVAQYWYHAYFCSKRCNTVALVVDGASFATSLASRRMLSVGYFA